MASAGSLRDIKDTVERPLLLGRILDLSPSLDFTNGLLWCFHMAILALLDS